LKPRKIPSELSGADGKRLGVLAKEITQQRKSSSLRSGCILTIEKEMVENQHSHKSDECRANHSAMLFAKS
jgi:hypothetical protein